MLPICVVVLSSEKGEVGIPAESRLTLQVQTASQSIYCRETPPAVAKTSECCSWCQAVWTQSTNIEVVMLNLINILLLLFLLLWHYASMHARNYDDNATVY